MAGVRRGTFTCVGWQVTLCDPIWQVTSRSSEVETPRKSYIGLYLYPTSEFHFLRARCLEPSAVWRVFCMTRILASNRDGDGCPQSPDRYNYWQLLTATIDANAAWLISRIWYCWQWLPDPPIRRPQTSYGLDSVVHMWISSDGTQYVRCTWFRWAPLPVLSGVPQIGPWADTLPPIRSGSGLI